MRFLRSPKTTIFTALPTGMTASDDGRTIKFLADATNGVVWDLRYRAFQADGVTPNPSPYKWECIGPQPLVSEAITADSSISWTTYAAPPNKPSVVAPLAGEYVFSGGAILSSPTAAVWGALAALKFSAAAAADSELLAYFGGAGPNDYGYSSRPALKRTVTAGQVCEMHVRASASNFNISQKMLTMTPLRVG
jgi:hypothetical protein